MFCVKCGVRLADTEKTCPLCGTVVYYPDIKQKDAPPLYPKGRYPQMQANSKVFNGMVIIVFFIPMLICLLSDLLADGKFDWFGLAAGGLVTGYILFALPLWFRKPNPVIFVPCDFAAATLYLLYIDLAAGGHWFMPFAFPVAGALCLIVTTFVTLLHYLKRGRLYIWGGTLIAFGVFILLIELLLRPTFGIIFHGWSVYPLVALVLIGGLLIYLGINASAREMMERKLFF